MKYIFVWDVFQIKLILFMFQAFFIYGLFWKAAPFKIKEQHQIMMTAPESILIISSTYFKT